MTTNVLKPFAGKGIISLPGQRSAKNLNACLDQFEIESEARYKPRDSSGDGKLDTFCNIWTGDATRALCCEVPHVVDNEGNPSTLTAGGHELSANNTIRWLRMHGARFGWSKALATDARAAANLGKPAIVGWVNPTGKSGHIAPLRPSPLEEACVANVGARNKRVAPVSAAFPGLKPLEFWIHE